MGYSDAKYFTPSLHDEHIARAKRSSYVPTLAQIHKIIAQMPTATIVERRNRALIAFTILTSPRDGATISIRMKHVDMIGRKIVQDGADMKTKFRKTFSTFFFPVGGVAEEIVSDWITELRTDHLFGPDDPVFPKTKVGCGATGGFEALGLDRAPWASTTAICDIFKQAFEINGLPHATPHSFRHTLGLYGLDVCKTHAELKAWSQNLGHSNMMTTLMSYGNISEADQGTLIANIGEDHRDSDQAARIAKIKEMAAAL